MDFKKQSFVPGRIRLNDVLTGGLGGFSLTLLGGEMLRAAPLAVVDWAALVV